MNVTNIQNLMAQVEDLRQREMPDVLCFLIFPELVQPIPLNHSRVFWNEVSAIMSSNNNIHIDRITMNDLKWCENKWNNIY